MTVERRYPDEPAGPFPEPPRSFTDREGRQIDLRELDHRDESQLDTLVGMYETFDPADRAQGIPPVGEEKIIRWLDSVLASSHDVVALHGDRIVGHATLVPDGEAAFELAIFVHQEYQQAGIGSRLLPALLGYGATAGVERVWLTVERWNHAAIALYKSVGFEVCTSESFELEMALRLH